MQYRKLGNTDVDVSSICLGTMNWGQQNTAEQAFEQMDYALEQGANFFLRQAGVRCACTRAANTDNGNP